MREEERLACSREIKAVLEKYAITDFLFAGIDIEGDDVGGLRCGTVETSESNRHRVQRLSGAVNQALWDLHDRYDHKPWEFPLD